MVLRKGLSLGISYPGPQALAAFPGKGGAGRGEPAHCEASVCGQRCPLLPLVLLGLHRGLVPIYAIQIESLGGTTLFPAVAMAGAGQVGAAIALYIKAKRVGNHRLNRVIAGALPAGILGIGEPLIYGVTLPLMKPFITAGLGAGFGGAYVMLTHVMSTAYSPSGLLAVTHMLPECMLNYLIGMVIAYIAAAVITYIFIPVEDIENA